MQGLIVIPDITGFTNFVKCIDINRGVSITTDLLNEIIDNNPLDLELSEIEGDAILFFKAGNPIPLLTIFSGIKKMYEAFNRKYQFLKMKYDINTQLSLKFILHYGDMTVYNIRGFKKLYGQSIIESHRLLKNGSDSSNYILITDDYMKALDSSEHDVFLSNWKYSTYSSQTFTDLREIRYYFFKYAPNNIMESEAYNYDLRA